MGWFDKLPERSIEIFEHQLDQRKSETRRQLTLG